MLTVILSYTDILLMDLDCIGLNDLEELDETQPFCLEYLNYIWYAIIK